MFESNRLPQFVTTSKGLSITMRDLDKSYPEHSHDFFEVEYIISGKGTVFLNDEPYELKPNTLCFFTPLDFQQTTVTQSIKLLNIMFTEAWIDDDIIHDLISPAIIYDYSFPLSERLNSEFNNTEKYNNIATRDILNIVLIDTARFVRRQIFSETKRLPKSIRSAMLYIQLHYRDEITLDDLANHVFLAPAYLSKIFKEYTGKGFSHYLLEIRLTYAKKLLLNSDYSITNICYMSGFSSFSHFLRCFKSRYGISPKKYREENKKTKDDSTFEKSVDYYLPDVQN